MSRDSLYIRSVAVEKLYGITMRGLRCDEFSPAINVIYGPNAQGKSSLGLAIHGLIWPQNLQGLKPTVQGTFEVGGQQFRVEIDGAGAAYQRDGLASAGPTVPDASHRNRYWLPLHKLLRAEDREFAEIIRRVALGGIDIEKAAEELGFQPPSTRPRAATRAVDQAHARVRKLEEQQRAVHEQAAGLATLKNDLAEAIAAEQRVSLFERGITHAVALREEQAARALLHQMPEAIANAREDDAAQLRQLRVEIAEAGDRKSVAERRLQQFESRRDANVVVLSGNPTSPVAKLEQQHSVLANLESGLTENRRAVAAARAVEKDAWGRIEGAVDVQQAEKIDVKRVSAVDRYIDEVEELRAEEKGYEALERILGSEDSSTLERQLRAREDAVATLRDWLRSEQETGRKVVRGRLFAIIAAVLFLAGAAAAFYFAFLVAAGVAAGAALALFLTWLLLPAATKASQPSEEHFSRRGIEPPSRWVASEVVDRLQTIEDESSDLRLRLRATQRREALQPMLSELEERRTRVEERRQEIAQELGISPPLRETQLRLFLDSLATWQKARADRMAAEGHLAEGERLAADIQADISATVAPFGVDSVATAAEARAVIEEIDEAYRELADVNREIERETLGLETAASAEASAQKRVNDIFARLRLDPGVGDEVVVRLSEELDSYRERYQEFILKEQALGEARRQLESHGAFDPELLDLDEDTLRNQHAAAQSTAGGKDRLIQQIAAVETRINELRRQHNLEAAIADYDGALDTLEREFEQAADAAVGDLLANHLIDRARDDQLPAVFARARDLFHRVSHGSYRLELDRREGRFYATDSVRERGFQLDELSSGTRVQLLLAVRIAFVEEQELGSRLPIVLDEALAISDDERAQAIVETLLTLAREGRQIFYFTAQHDEVAKWKRALEGVDHRLIPLGVAAEPHEIDATALPGGEFGRHVPAPEGRDRQEYGAELHVPGWNAHMPVGELHLWYLVRDPEELHGLLQRGFHHWGQVAAIGRDGALDAAGLDAETFARMAVKAAALETWQRCWRIGRGQRLGRQALAECPAIISATFLDRVVELCGEVQDDAAALVDRLRQGAVSGFRANKMDELEQYLIDGGYIDRQVRLTDKEVWSRVASHVFEEVGECGMSLEEVDQFLAEVREGPPRLHLQPVEEVEE
jgi:uncharacterized protein YhaN